MCNALDVATRTDVADVPGRATHVGCNHQVPGLECLTEHTIGRGKPCTTRMSPCLAHSCKFPNLVAKSGYPRPVRTTPGAHSGNLSSLHAAIVSTMPMMMHSTVQCGTRAVERCLRPAPCWILPSSKRTHTNTLRTFFFHHQHKSRRPKLAV